MTDKIEVTVKVQLLTDGTFTEVRRELDIPSRAAAPLVADAVTLWICGQGEELAGWVRDEIRKSGA